MNNFYKENKRESKYISEITRYCKCGHSVQFKNPIPYVICSHCGKLIFRNKNVNMIIILRGDLQNVS